MESVSISFLCKHFKVNAVAAVTILVSVTAQQFQCGNSSTELVAQASLGVSGPYMLNNFLYMMPSNVSLIYICSSAKECNIATSFVYGDMTFTDGAKAR